MKSKKGISPEFDEIIPLLIQHWRRYLKIPGPPDRLQTREFRAVVSDVKALQEMVKDGKSLLGTDYFADPHLLGSYLLYQWMIHYQEGLSLIGELPTAPKRVLDVCSGPAAFSLAALRHGAREVFAIDRNLTALQVGAEICGRVGYPITIRRWDAYKTAFPVEGKFDLIIIGHALLELFPEPSQQEEMERFALFLMKKLTPQGFLLIVDSSFPAANRRILQLRDVLVEQGVPVQAPCVWKGSCPVASLPNSPCYAQRELEKPFLLREIQRAASINLSSLKMTYILFRSPEAGWPETEEAPLYRVISPPVESFQGKRFYLCGVDGKKSLGSRFEVQPKTARAFDYLKRGELIEIQHALEGPHTMDIIEGTDVTIRAACGKPLTASDKEEL